jgi:2-dehydropantoate 2-reductase
VTAYNGPMRIAVLGSGGVGGYFGGRLAVGGSEVTFIARGAHLEAIRRHGLRLTSPLGDAHVVPANAVETIAQVGQVDLVIVAVKLWDTEQIAPSLRPLAERGAAIISFQNGVRKDELLRKYIPPEAIMGGIAYIAAAIAEPGVILHTGTMQRLVFGEYGGGKSERGERFLQACLKAGIDAEFTDAIEQRIWEKFVFLVGLSGLTSIVRQPIGPICQNAQTRSLLLDTMREVVAVGRAKGVPLAADFAENRLAFCDTLPAVMTSSMQTDLERGNRLELPWLSGSVVELGAALGVPTPVNRVISDALALYANGNDPALGVKVRQFPSSRPIAN